VTTNRLEHRFVTRGDWHAQKKVEGHNFDIRKHLLEYDDVMNQQRKTIYSLRREVLEGRYSPVGQRKVKAAGWPVMHPRNQEMDAGDSVRRLRPRITVS